MNNSCSASQNTKEITAQRSSKEKQNQVEKKKYIFSVQIKLNIFCLLSVLHAQLSLQDDYRGNVKVGLFFRLFG